MLFSELEGRYMNILFSTSLSFIIFLMTFVIRALSTCPTPHFTLTPPPLYPHPTPTLPPPHPHFTPTPPPPHPHHTTCEMVAIVCNKFSFRELFSSLFAVFFSQYIVSSGKDSLVFLWELSTGKSDINLTIIS